MRWRIELSTELAAPAERVWAEVQTPRLLNHVVSPLLKFKPVTPAHWPERWETRRYRVQMFGFGVLPLGGQWVNISLPLGEPPVRVVRDNGSGDLAKVWDHWIEIATLADGRTRYTDRVFVEAGLLTPFIWLFALLFYAHRQSRWRAWVRSNFKY
jgi:hypothetical protein